MSDQSTEQLPAEAAAPAQEPITPIHQWTHDGQRVLIVKCVSADGLSFNDFRWPTSGPVRPEYCKPDDECSTGGLFGWAWGLNLGDGKDPDFTGRWIVFSARPDQIIRIGDKVKVAAEKPEDVDAIVEFYGDWWRAMEFTHLGRAAWIRHAASGAASATGDSGAASATGYRGAASATGDRGAASATGYRGAASATGDRGAASATGARGAASATGYSGAASATGYRGAASATGYRGAASITREWSKIEVGPRALGAVTADNFYWLVREEAIVACRWQGDSPGAALLCAKSLGLKPGARVHVAFGKIQPSKE